MVPRLVGGSTTSQPPENRPRRAVTARQGLTRRPERADERALAGGYTRMSSGYPGQGLAQRLVLGTSAGSARSTSRRRAARATGRYRAGRMEVLRRLGQARRWLGDGVDSRPVRSVDVECSRSGTNAADLLEVATPAVVDDRLAARPGRCRPDMVNLRFPAVDEHGLDGSGPPRSDSAVRIRRGRRHRSSATQRA